MRWGMLWRKVRRSHDSGAETKPTNNATDQHGRRDPHGMERNPCRLQEGRRRTLTRYTGRRVCATLSLSADMGGGSLWLSAAFCGSLWACSADGGTTCKAAGKITGNRQPDPCGVALCGFLRAFHGVGIKDHGQGIRTAHRGAQGRKTAMIYKGERRRQM